MCQGRFKEFANVWFGVEIPPEDTIGLEAGAILGELIEPVAGQAGLAAAAATDEASDTTVGVGPVSIKCLEEFGSFDPCIKQGVGAVQAGACDEGSQLLDLFAIDLRLRGGMQGQWFIADGQGKGGRPLATQHQGRAWLVWSVTHLGQARVRL